MKNAVLALLMVVGVVLFVITLQPAPILLCGIFYELSQLDTTIVSRLTSVRNFDFVYRVLLIVLFLICCFT